MRQNAFGGQARLRLGPLGELERSPDPLAAIGGEGCLLLRGREGKRMGKGKEEDGKREGRGWEGGREKEKGRGGREGEGRLASHTIFRP